MLAASAAAHAAEYRNANLGFSVDLGPDWKVASDAELRKLETAARAATSQPPNGKYEYVVGYSRDPKGKLAVPFLVVQFTPMPMENATYADLAKGFSADVMEEGGKRVQQASNGALSGVKVGRAVVDAKSNRLLATMDLQSPTGTLRATMIGFFSKDGVIQFNVYSTPADAAAQVASVERGLQTFRFDPGYQFAPTARRDAYALSRGMGAVAFYCLLGALLVYAVKKGIDRRKQSQPSR